MSGLREQIGAWMGGRTCLVGVGNEDAGDDAFGVTLAERLRAAIGASGLWGDAPEVIVVGTAPERHLARLADGGFDAVLFLDAVDFDGAPGSVILLDAERIAQRFPQISTHKVSLGALARAIQAGGNTRVGLLGVQPDSIKASAGLSPSVLQTIDMLVELFVATMAPVQTGTVRI